MRTIFTGGKNSDLTVKVKRKNFKCHKNIISARSTVFKAMLQHNMKEKRTGIIKIIDADPHVFHNFLLYLYSCDTSVLKFEYVTGLYQLADKYHVEDLVKVCRNFMLQNISPENIFEFHELGKRHNEDELIKATMHFFTDHCRELVRGKSWMDFLKRNPEAANVLIEKICYLSSPRCSCTCHDNDH